MALKGATVGAAVIVGTLWFYRRSPIEIHSSVPYYAYGAWVRMAIPLLFITGQFAVLKRTDTIMIGALIGTDEAGFYVVAGRISDLVLFVYVVASGILAPLISELHAADRSEELQRVLAFATRGIFLATLAAAIAIAVLGRFGLGIFGPEFSVAYAALLILVVGNLLHGAWGVAGYVLSMTGHQTTAALFGGAAVLMNLALNATFIPRWGMAGAASATAIATAMWHLGMSLYVWRRLGIRTTVAFV
jgi:O-antigen/teichoic acid export membrane protein